MDAATSRSVSGPMVGVTWLVAVGWLALTIGSLVALPAPNGVVLAVVGAMGGAATAWLALSMRVRYDEHGVVLGRHGHVPWSELQGIEIAPGLLSVPVALLARGRAISEVPLDGLAWFGGPDGYARTLAEQVARPAGLAVGVRAEGEGRARRSL